jgi:hypothetical protein
MPRADGRRHPLDGVGVEGRRPGERRGVDRRAVRGEPSEALLVGDRGQAVAGAGDEVGLQLREPPRAVARLDRVGAEHPREVADAVLGDLLVDAVGRHLELLGRHCLALALAADPDARELGELLLERHVGEQRLHALVQLARGVGPGALCGGHRSAPLRAAISGRR